LAEGLLDFIRLRLTAYSQDLVIIFEIKFPIHVFILALKSERRKQIMGRACCFIQGRKALRMKRFPPNSNGKSQEWIIINLIISWTSGNLFLYSEFQGGGERKYGSED
jgi:hypothetical protein